MSCSGNTVLAISAGTVDVPLKNAFGPGYEPFAFATLSPDAGPFRIIPIDAAIGGESLRQTKVIWKWSVLPLEAGTQVLDVDIEVLWRPVGGKTQAVHEYRIGDKQFGVQVNSLPSNPEPPVSVAPIKIDIGAIMTNVLPYLLGTGGIGVIALIATQIRRRSNKRKPQKAQSNTKQSNRKNKQKP